MEFARFPLEWVVGDDDSDADGIPDFHEEAVGLDPNNPADAGIDSDGDGRSALEEFLASTNPGQRDSVLAVRQFAAGAQRSLSWSSVPYVEYQVKTSITLDGSDWTPVPGLERVRASATETRVDLPADAEGKRFYRVRVR